jgi:hypothetical protein
MRKISKFLFLSFLLFSDVLYAQPGLSGESVMPYHPNYSPTFANDIILNAQPTQNQHDASICSAFNGWLYGVYSFSNIGLFQDSTVLLRSKDNGNTWQVINSFHVSSPHTAVKKSVSLACGTDTINLKLFVAYAFYDTANNINIASVARYDKDGVFEDGILKNEINRNIRDIALASDDLFPANGSNPFSLAIVYSKHDISDSITFWVSNDGGNSFGVHKSIAHTNKYFGKVSLSYGRSASYPEGRYFAAWEEKVDASSLTGHIYTAHSEPNFNSAFTIPVLVDTLDPLAANNARNPVISCQNSNSDNDLSNLTEIILFDKYIPASQKYNIGGVFNKEATTTSTFHKFTIDPSANNKLQPDICFNAFDSTFLVTYFDSTAQKLPYYLHDYNMTNPDTWTGLSSGYNDYDNLVSPHPHVVMDFGKRTGANVWIGLRDFGYGVATFDAPFHYYVGENNNRNNNDSLKISVYPNPASDYAFLDFTLQTRESTKITILNQLGQITDIIDFKPSINSKQHHRVDLSNYHCGLYFIRMNAGNSTYSGKLVVIK